MVIEAKGSELLHLIVSSECTWMVPVSGDDRETLQGKINANISSSLML